MGQAPSSTTSGSLGSRILWVLRGVVLSGLAGLVIGIAWLAWTGWFSRLELDVEERLIEAYIRDLQPHLPFQIERFEVQKAWSHVIRGKIDDVNLVLRFETALGRFGDARADWRLRMHGPVTIGRAPPDAAHPGEKHYALEFQPDATLEKLGKDGKPLSQSPPLALKLWLRAAESLHHVDAVGLATRDVRVWDWKPVGVSLRDFDWHMSWDIEDGLGRVAASAGSLRLDAGRDHEINVSRARFSVDTPLRVSTNEPVQLGPEIHLSWDGGDGEVLWGDTYLDLPLKSVPIDARLRVVREDPAQKPRIEALDARIGRAGSQGRLHAEVRQSRLRVTWNDDGLDLRETIHGLLAATASGGARFAALAPLRELEFRRGKFHADLVAEAPLDFAAHPDPARLSGHGQVELRDADADWKKARLALRGLELLLPYDLRPGRRALKGSVSIRKWGFRNFVGELGKTTIDLFPKANRSKASAAPGVATGAAAWDVTIGQGATLPLAVDGLPLQVGAFRGTLGGGEAFHLQSSLKLRPTPLAKVVQLACGSTRHVPPATATVEFKELDFAPGTIEPAGYARVELFDGFVEADELGIYDLGTPVPELDFSVRFNQIRLDELGSWIGFGEMDGILTGFFKDVTFQSWLPTRFEVKVEAKPFSRNKIVFSPDAMKNFMRLFIADTIDMLPGIADWLAFGWPSRLFSGYDVNYLGIYLFSQDGTILLETLDPPEIFKRERKHYILYGPRFKMPLVSKTYPVAADAAAAANLIHHMTHQVHGLMDTKDSKKKDKGKTDETPSEESEDVNCGPAL